MNFKMIAAAAALLAAGTANAALTSFDGGAVNGNGSVVLLKLDSTGTTTQGLIADLGVNFNDFAFGGIYAGANNKIVWDFAANTITINGVAKTDVTNNWASAFATFASGSNANEAKWAIASGSQQDTNVNAMLASGNPTASQLTQQGSAVTAKMAAVNATLIAGNANNGTLGTADNGAYSMGKADAGYVGGTTVYGPTTANGWLNNTKWTTWSVDGAKTNLVQVGADGTNVRVGDISTYAPGLTYDTTGLLGTFGTFGLTGNTLVWQTATAAVPEPESIVLALAGVAALAVARRRAAK